MFIILALLININLTLVNDHKMNPIQDNKHAKKQGKVLKKHYNLP